MIKWSRCPSKQLLYFWLLRDIPKFSRWKPVGLDVGCGKDLGNYPLFRSWRYIGIDLDIKLLDAIKPERRNNFYGSDDIFIIRNLLTTPFERGDFVLCVQVLTNKHFDTQNTVQTVDRLIDMTHMRGTLIFNTSKFTMQHEPVFEPMLYDSFERVTVRRYGAWSEQRTNFAPLLAGIMWAIPWLRHRGHHQKTYYICERKCKP